MVSVRPDRTVATPPTLFLDSWAISLAATSVPGGDVLVAYRGATLAQLREARRALARRDFAAARALARTIIDAWSVADVAVPAVGEMKALIAKLPPEPAPR
ncbi:MAG: hypothetical protein U1F43_09490 [Myxococcota bacterium]